MGYLMIREVIVNRLPRRSEEYGGVDPQEAATLLGSDAVFLDVREPSEWLAGHVTGALHVPLGELANRLETVPRDRCVVVVCRSGSRSARATSLLVESGFTAVNLEGGLQAWASAGLPVDTDDGGRGTVT